jgi:hypothetical protein
LYLVICNSYDKAAIWAYEGLKAQGLCPIELIDADSLVCSPHVEHRIKNDKVNTKIELPDGRQIDSEQTQGVLNRLQSIPTSNLKASKADNEYAFQELNAFFISWLYSLPPPVLNPATPEGFSGRLRHISSWILIANSAGLTTPKFELKSTDADKTSYYWMGRLVPPETKVTTVFVVDSAVVGDHVPPEVAEGCRRLAELAETPLLGINFSENPDSPWMFAGASASPNLTLGGEALLQELSRALQKRREGHL